MDISAVVIWGYPLHSHTHSYIHQAFYRAFSFLGYTCYWFDDNTAPNDYNMLPDNCLFLSAGGVCNNIVLNPKSHYILHNCDLQKFIDAGIPNRHILIIQVFTLPCLPRCGPLNSNKFIRFDGKTLYMPWATDLLPYEINTNIEELENISKNYKHVCHFVGMFLENPWNMCKEVCDNNQISFMSVGGFSGNNVSIENNQSRIQESIIAPAFQEPWQIENGYIPCRIFKNISYGKMGITNNEVVQELFSGKLVFDKDIKVVTQKAINNVKNDNNLELLKELMIEVRDNHTYLNRISDIFKAFSLIN